MKNWIYCPLLVFLSLSPLQSHAQWVPAWVAFHGIDRKHVQYSFNGLVLVTVEDELTVAITVGPTQQFHCRQQMPNWPAPESRVFPAAEVRPNGP